MEKIERWKILANIFTNKNKKVFINKINGDLHFCKIILIDEDFIKIKNFGPEQRKDKIEEIYWAQISKFDEHKEVKRNE